MHEYIKTLFGWDNFTNLRVKYLLFIKNSSISLISESKNLYGPNLAAQSAKIVKTPLFRVVVFAKLSVKY